MTQARARVAVVGVGNPYRGDDAAGRLVARKLREGGLPGADVLELEGAAAELIEVLGSYEAVVVVDAVRSPTSEVGHIHRFEAGQGPLPTKLRSVSSHGFGVGEAIELARALGRLPGVVIVYGIESEAFEPGTDPGPAVSGALGHLTEVIVADVRALLDPSGGSRWASRQPSG